MKLKRKRKKGHLVFLVLIILTILGICFQKATKNASKLYLEYAKIEVERIMSNIINNSVTEEALQKLKNNDLYNVYKNQTGEIETIDYDAVTISLYLKEVTANIENNLNSLENKTILEIPLFSLLDNPLFNTLGPNIKVKVKPIGRVETQIMTEVKQYGINNSLIEMFIYVEAHAKIILPIISDNITIENRIPISYKIISGKIPYYYGGSGIFGNYAGN